MYIYIYIYIYNQPGLLRAFCRQDMFVNRFLADAKLKVIALLLLVSLLSFIVIIHYYYYYDYDCLI